MKESPPAPRRTGLWPRNPYLAAAASLLLLLGAGILARELLAPAPVDRNPGESGIVSLVPEDGLLDRANLVLEWSRVGEDARYEVKVTTATLHPVASAIDLVEPRYTVPESDLKGLPGGEKLYWQVTAHLEDGGTNRSQTFVVTIR